MPKPPIATGITIKKIITKACAVTITLYRCSSFIKEPIVPSSVRITKDIPRPTNPAYRPPMKYRVPISLWFVEVKNRKRLWGFEFISILIVKYNRERLCSDSQTH